MCGFAQPSSLGPGEEETLMKRRAEQHGQSRSSGRSLAGRRVASTPLLNSTSRGKDAEEDKRVSRPMKRQSERSGKVVKHVCVKKENQKPSWAPATKTSGPVRATGGVEAPEARASSYPDRAWAWILKDSPSSRVMLISCQHGRVTQKKKPLTPRLPLRPACLPTHAPRSSSAWCFRGRSHLRSTTVEPCCTSASLPPSLPPRRVPDDRATG